MSTATTSPERRRAFGPSDRCDRCGAQAFVRALFPVGELLFCGHHARVYEDGLLAGAMAVEDGTSALRAS